MSDRERIREFVVRANAGHVDSIRANAARNELQNDILAFIDGMPSAEEDEKLVELARDVKGMWALRHLAAETLEGALHGNREPAAGLLAGWNSHRGQAVMCGHVLHRISELTGSDGNDKEGENATEEDAAGI